MARGGKGKPTSKSALQLKDEDEARHLKEVPLLSFEGLRVHKTKVVAIFVGALVFLSIFGLVITSATSAANVELAAPSAFGQAKPGDIVNFTVTVKNTAAFSSFAYELHLLGLPSGWFAAKGEEVFPLKAGESRSVAISVDTGESTPPNHAYPFTAKVLVKSGDLKSTLSSKAVALTVQVISSNLSLTFESRGSSAAFWSTPSTVVLPFSSPCGDSAEPLWIEIPAGASSTGGGFDVGLAATDPNATGFVTADLGADGSVDSNASFSARRARVTFGGEGISNYSSAHAADVPNLTVPVRVGACVNASAWSLTLDNLSVGWTLGASSLSQTAFSRFSPSAALSFGSCGVSAYSPTFRLPADANVTSASFTVTFVPNDPRATGYLAADVGADGSLEANISLSFGSARMGLALAGFANASAAHPGAPGNLTVPVRFESCTNATSWNFTFNNVLMNWQRPVAPGELTPVDLFNPNSATGDARLLARVRNGEPKTLLIVISIPDLPAGWDSTPTLGNTPFPVPASGSNTFEFTLRIAKTAPQGNRAVNFTACVQVNPNDCVEGSALIAMPSAPFFTVLTYVEPPILKEVARGRAIDVLLFAQNLGNQPTAFTFEVPPAQGLSISWWDGSGNLTPGQQVPLALNQSRLFVMRVAADPGAPVTVHPLRPIFKNVSAGIIQQNVILSVNLQDAPAEPRAVEVGNRVTVEFAGATADGLLFDTDIFSMLPLIDQKKRPTHPLYEKPAATSLTLYEFTVQKREDYTNLEHKGFEGFLAGMWERETRVFWLTPDDTQYPATAFLKDTIVVFEVRIASLVPR